MDADHSNADHGNTDYSNDFSNNIKHARQSDGDADHEGRETKKAKSAPSTRGQPRRGARSKDTKNANKSKKEKQKDDDDSPPRVVE